MLPDFVKLKDIKPELSSYVRDAYLMLGPDEVPDEKVVHDVRVLLKKSRATMKLLKSQIEEPVFSREYLTYREAGRIMQAWRETSVHRKILRDLRKKHPDVFLHLDNHEKIVELLTKPEIISTPSLETKENIEKIRELLYKSGYRLRFENMNKLDPQLLLKDLENTYITVSECYLTARNASKPANLHEFRKKSKDFLYQLYFFRSLKPKVVKDLEGRLEALSQNLGKFNDLAILIDTLGYKYIPSAESDHSLDELVVIIRNEQDRYLSKMWPEAYRIFCPGQKLVNVLGFKLLVI